MSANVSRTQATFSSEAASASELASIPTKYGSERLANAVASSPIRAIEPPWYQGSIVEWGEGAPAACSTRRSITSSLSSGRFTDFQ